MSCCSTVFRLRTKAHYTIPLPDHLSSSFLHMAICGAQSELFLLLASSCFKCWTVKWQGSQCQFFKNTHIDLCVVVEIGWCLMRRPLNHLRYDTEIPLLGRVTKSTHCNWMPGFGLALLLCVNTHVHLLSMMFTSCLFTILCLKIHTLCASLSIICWLCLYINIGHLIEYSLWINKAYQQS